MNLVHPNASFLLEPLADGRRRLTVVPSQSSYYINRTSIITSYPDDLLSLILSTKGPAYLCDEIASDQDPACVQAELKRELFAYFLSEELDGHRILDFGCGEGASTMILQRLFSHSEVYGMELEPDLLSIAHARARFYGFPESRLMLSPSSTEIPVGIGRFDLVILSAVYEHLLPRERELLLPKLWSLLTPHGFLFLNQTPHRFSPVEGHTTGLPLLNYLPDRLTHFIACKVSRKVAPTASWESLLRQGIRGGTPREILRNISAGSDRRPALLEPSHGGIHDRIDLWFATSSSTRWRAPKHVLRLLLKSIRRLTGITIVPFLSLAIRKAGGLGGTETKSASPKHISAVG